VLRRPRPGPFSPRGARAPCVRAAPTIAAVTDSTTTTTTTAASTNYLENYYYICSQKFYDIFNYYYAVIL
jgi:hypothetical protein